MIHLHLLPPRKFKKRDSNRNVNCHHVWVISFRDTVWTVGIVRRRCGITVSLLLYTCSSPTVNHDVLPFNIVSSNSLDQPAWATCRAKRQPQRWQKLPLGKVVFEVHFFYYVSRQERVEFRTYTATTHQVVNGIFLPVTFCFDVVRLYKPSSVFPLMSFTKVIYDFNTHPLTFLVHRHQLMMTLNLLVSVQFMRQNAAPCSVHRFFRWILSNQSLAGLMTKTSFASFKDLRGTDSPPDWNGTQRSLWF